MATNDKKYGSPIDYAYEGARLGRKYGAEYTPAELRQRATDYFEFMRGRVWNRIEVLKSGDWAGSKVEVPTACPLDLKGFFVFAGFGSKRWEKYRNDEAYEDTVEWVENAIESQNVGGGLVGAYNANLVAKIHKIAEKTETTATVKIEPITGMRII